jgi:kinesin family protein 4/21/27
LLGFGLLFFCDLLLTQFIFNVKVLMQAIEHELEVTLRIHEVRSEYERQLQE